MPALGVISDLHFGSKACMEAAIGECVRWAHGSGARTILIPGDLLQGEDPRWRWELSHHGLEDQAKACVRGLPELKGLKYYAIGGNHDHKYDAVAGLSTLTYIERMFKSQGRTDFVAIGDGCGRISIDGLRCELWHPLGGGGKYPVGPIARKVRSYPVNGKRPHVLLAGHWHRFLHTEDLGVQGIACPTFQTGESFFGQRMESPPSLGGLLIRASVTGGRVKRFSIERWIT